MHASHWPVTNSHEALIYIYIYNNGGGASNRFSNCVSQTNEQKQTEARKAKYVLTLR